MTINCKGQLIDVSNPKVMGILNLTPDSFYDGGKYSNEKEIFGRLDKMVEEGRIAIPPGGTLEKGSIISMFIRMLIHNAMEEQMRQAAIEAEDEDDDDD